MKFRNQMITFAGIAALALSSLALAQQEQGYNMQQTPPETMEVSDTQLEQFVEAQSGIAAVQNDFSQRLEGVEDPEAANELQVEANEQMIEKVEEAGLDVESFNAIAMAIQNDPDLQQKISQMMQDQG